MPQGERRRFLAITAAVTLVACGLLTWLAQESYASLVDDAYISARYADHLAEGFGVTYSAGEPPVEGVTNIGWVFLLALGRLLGFEMYTLLTGLSMAFGLASVVFAVLLTRSLVGRDDLLIVVPGLLIALDPHMAVATTNGLESSMFIAGTLAAMWAAFSWRSRPAAATVSAALMLVRPEGFAVAAALCLGELYKTRDAARKALPFVGVVVGSALLFTAVRYAYFGDILPNTFAAKSSFSLLNTFSVNEPYLSVELNWFIALPVAFVLVTAAPPWKEQKLLTSAIALGLGVIPLTVNLWMPGLRLFLPAAALVAVLGTVALTRLPRKVGWGLAVLCIAGMAGYHYESGKRIRYYDWRHTVEPGNGTELAARHLAAYADEGAWLATRDAGVLAYYVGTGVKVAELHQRALTQPHPDGRSAKVKTYTPTNPAFFASTIRRTHQEDFIYSNDRAIFDRFDVPYVYLGRVRQHFHRFYDIYARADLEVPPLPRGVMVNKNGPKPKIGAEQAPAEAPGEPAAPQDPVDSDAP